MTKNEFLRAFANNLDIEKDLCEEMVLHDLDEWDSMAFLATMSLFDELFGLKISGESLKECTTLADVLVLAGGNIA